MNEATINRIAIEKITNIVRDVWNDNGETAIKDVSFIAGIIDYTNELKRELNHENI